ATDLDLRLERPAPAGAPVDVSVTAGPVAPVPFEQPVGAVVAAYSNDEAGVRFCAVRTDDGDVVVRFPGACDARIAAGLDAVQLVRDPSIGADTLPLLFNGLVTSLLLMLRGSLVLHASAVAVEGDAVAFAGHPRRGKSTSATLACAAGAALVTDDVLRVDQPGGGLARCWVGGGETRLRASAGTLADAFTGASFEARMTVDGRTALRLPLAAADPLRLRAVVVPLPDREADAVDVRRLDPAQAHLTLTSYPRVLGLADPALTGAQFLALADLVATVPVVEARLPWGPPYDPATMTELFAQLGLALP
ncbi:hypothetical protein, partial [Motilibacter deserti]